MKQILFLTIYSIVVVIAICCAISLIIDEIKYDYVCVEYQTIYVSEPNRRFSSDYNPTYTTRPKQKCVEWKKVKKGE